MRARLAAIGILGLAAVCRADVVEDARNTKRAFVHNNARVADLAEGKLVFVGDTGQQLKIELSAIRRVELAARTEKDFNDAERTFAEGPEAYRKAVPLYVTAAKTPGGPVWKPRFINARLVLVHAKLDNSEEYVKAMIALHTANPKDAEALAAQAESPAVTDAAKKTLGEAINAADRNKRDSAALRTVMDRWGGSGTGPATKKAGGTDPVTKVDPGGSRVDPVGKAGAPAATADIVANVTPAGPEQINGIVSSYGDGKGDHRRAADLFLKTELDLETADKEAERYLVAGGLSCIKVSQDLTKEMDKIRAAAFEKNGEERNRLLKDADAVEPRRVRYLMQGAIALAQAIDLPDGENKRFAEAAYWCAWAHEQLNRPLRARSLYANFISKYSETAPKDLVAQARAAVERLSEGG